MKTIAMKLVVSLGLLATAYGQQVNLQTQVKNTLKTSNGGRGPAPTGTSLPSNCTVGDLFFKTNAVAGQNEYGCTSSNTWTLESGAGSSALQATNAQTGATYTYLNTDCSSLTTTAKLVTHSNASAIAGTLPQANGSTFVAGCVIDVLNIGAGALTITPTVSTFQNGATAIILYTGQFARIVSTGTNYNASGSFVLCPTCASSIDFAPGTAPTIVANTATEYAPTSITAYSLRKLAAACTGILLLTNAANDMVPTCLASTGTGNAVRANNAVMDSLTVTTSCTGCGGITGLTNASSVPFVQSSNVLTQDTGFSFNATGTVTPSAGIKYLNLASTNNSVVLAVTSNNLFRGGFGAASGDGLNIVDQAGSPIWLQTYGTLNSAFGGRVTAPNVRTTPVAVASLPACAAGTEGLHAAVNDSNAASYTAGIGAVVANGGTTHVPVYCDGTNWRIG